MRSSFHNALRAVITACVCLAAASSQAQYAYGSDVSWTDQEESSGYTFKSAAGVKTDPFVLLKGLGINAIRLRVWVNPTGGWNNGADDLYNKVQDPVIPYRDIMNCKVSGLDHSVIGSLTAYAIGWVSNLPRLTHLQIENPVRQ